MPKIEMGKKYRTRDGRDVRVLCVDASARPFYPVIALIDESDIETFTSEGLRKVGQKSDYDLIEVKEKKVGWTVISRGKPIFPTKEDAVSNAGPYDFVAKVEWEE